MRSMDSEVSHCCREERREENRGNCMSTDRQRDMETDMQQVGAKATQISPITANRYLHKVTTGYNALGTAPRSDTVSHYSILTTPGTTQVGLPNERCVSLMQ